MTESAADSTAAAQGGGGERYLCSLGFRGKKTPGGVGTYRGTHGRTRGKRATHSVRIRTYRRTVSVTAHAWRVTGRFSSDSIPAHIATGQFFPLSTYHSSSPHPRTPHLRPRLLQQSLEGRWTGDRLSALPLAAAPARSLTD